MKLIKIDGIVYNNKIEFEEMIFEVLNEMDGIYYIKWLDSKKGMKTKIPTDDVGKMRRYFHALKQRDAYSFVFEEGKYVIEEVKKKIGEMALADMEYEINLLHKRKQEIEKSLIG